MSWEAWGDPPDPPEMETCPDCDGSGEWKNEAGETVKYPTCHGEGEIEQPDMRFDDDIVGGW